MKRFNLLLLRPQTKWFVWALLAIPFAWYVAGAINNTLGANPAEAILRGLGDWVLRFLWLTLAVTPLRRWTGLNALVRMRRWFGVTSFVYGVLHFLAYAWLDMGLDPQAIWHDLDKRPFALVGFLALVLMAPLAATSVNAMIRRLGGKRWQQLHKLVYPIAGLGLLHFFWMRAAKSRYTEVAVYAVVLGVLLLARWRPAPVRTVTRSA